MILTKSNERITFKGLHQNGLIFGEKNTDNEVIYSFSTGEEIDFDHIIQDLKIYEFINKIENKNKISIVYTDELFSSVYTLTKKYDELYLYSTEKYFSYFYNNREGKNTKKIYDYIDVSDIDISSIVTDDMKYDVHIFSNNMSTGSIMNVIDDSINNNNDIYIYNRCSILDAMIIKYHMLKNTNNVHIKRKNDYYIIYTKTR